jgi:hypothetical protein
MTTVPVVWDVSAGDVLVSEKKDHLVNISFRSPLFDKQKILATDFCLM